MMRWLALLLFALLSGCASDQPTRTAMLDRGFGGTGFTACGPAAHAGGDSGFGGTGHSAECGMGGTGVIGTITDFGSIWVNGLEIELKPGLRVDTNLGGQVKLGIGHQVITTARPDAQGRPATDRVRVFYAVAGQVSARNGDSLTIAGQHITLDGETRGLRDVRQGDWVAVSALPQGESRWLATRIDPNPNRVSRIARPQLDSLDTSRALLQGTVMHRDGHPVLAPYDLPLNNLDLHDGTLAVVAAQREARHWQVEQIETLRHWRVDWQQMRSQMQEVRALHHQMRESREMREHGEDLREMREQSEDLHEAREQQEHLREQQENLRESRELYEQQEELREERETWRMDRDQD